MNYLVDTNVLCEPRQKLPDAKVLNWLKANESNLYTSVLVLGEILYGIELLSRNSVRRADLVRWHKQLNRIMQSRILSINARVAQEWAKLQAETHAKNLVLPIVDSLLAATARRYQLTISTDNVKGFISTGVSVFNPFD